MSPKKTIKDLSKKELLEDLKYYVCYANTQSPSFTDKTFDIILKYVNELEERPPEAMGKEFIEEFLSRKTSIPLIAKIIEKETNEEYCSSEIIAELIFDKLKEKWDGNNE